MPKWKSRIPFRNSEGRLYRHIDIKLIIGTDIKAKRHRAAPGKGYTLENIREACDEMINALEKGFPGVEFREVQVAPNAFNYIACEPAPKLVPFPIKPSLVLSGELYCSPKKEEVKSGDPKESNASAAGEDLAAANSESEFEHRKLGQVPQGSDGEGEQPQQSDSRTTASSGSTDAGVSTGERTRDQ